MSIIEQATRRLEELRRGGVSVPWEAAGLSEARFDELLGKASPNAVAAPRGASAPARDAAPSVAAPKDHTSESALVRRTSQEVVIDLHALAAKGYLIPANGRSDLALEFRHIKRPLLANVVDVEHDGRRNSLIMVTSAVAGEGKTFCALNLAMSIAMEVDTSVLLVDADVVRPAVLDRLGLGERRGLLDVLADESLDLADVILRTNVPKLSILPAGTRSTVATELLASAAMDELLSQLATRYPDRVIILDSPPLLPTAESRILASRVGQVLIVVDAERTTTSRVNEAFLAVENCPLVASVLNRCPLSSHRHGYGYGPDGASA